MTDSNAPSVAQMATPNVALIGFGEAGSAFASAAAWNGQTSAWDIDPARRSLMAQYNVSEGADAASALTTADIVLSLVTADSAVAAAQDYAPHLKPGTLWCDMNSVAPGSKRQAAEAITAAGARYVDVAVMAPVGQQLTVPLLIAGPDAHEAEHQLHALGFSNRKIAGDLVGRASAIKMIRSIMVKGMEALTWECANAAEKAGVMEEVIASLDASEKDWDWGTKTAYNRERMETHGIRRAAEMEEVAKTLRELGVDPVMSVGTVTLQRQAGTRSRERKNSA